MRSRTFWRRYRNRTSAKYAPEDFHLDLLKAHIAHDVQVLNDLLGKVKPITPEHDAKLQTLLGLLPVATLEHRQEADLHAVQ